METEFPKSDNKFITAKDFQDTTMTLTYKGFKRKANEDTVVKGVVKTWKEKLKYCLPYSFPEWAIDPQTGEKRLDKKGQPFRNSNWLADFPQGYTIVYYFEEGEFDSGSRPLWNALCRLQPKPGERLAIKKTGTDKETKWFVNRASGSDLPEVDVDKFSKKEYSGDPEVNEEIPF